MEILKKRVKGLLLAWDERVRLLVAYRYISLVIASVFYYFNDFHYNVYFKLGILATLGIASTILNNLYKRHSRDQRRVILLLVIETLSNILLIIPTGLHHSPYLWYALNTLLVAAFLVNIKACIWNLIIYLGAIAVIMLRLEQSDMFMISLDTYNISFNYILSLLLNIVLIILVAIYLSKTIEENRLLFQANEKLERANKSKNELMTYLIEVQSALNFLTMGEDYEQVCDYILDAAKKLLEAKHVFFYMRDTNSIISNKKEAVDSDFIKLIKSYSHNTSSVCIDKSMDESIITIPIQTASKDYGELIVYKASDNRLYRYDAIEIIGELGAMAFDRVSYLIDSKELTIAKEQNRIAGEIHDNALQRLFGLSCNIYGLINKRSDLDSDVLDILKSYRLAINSAMQDIRATIYDMSFSNTAKTGLKENLDAYIANYRDVDIRLDFKGQEELLNVTQQQCLYRIVSEGVSNAVRHGGSKNIDISIDVNGLENTIGIVDDGKGFDMNKQSKGLGLNNIKTLTNTLGGELSIKSIIGSGTRLKITIPIKQMDKGGNTNESIIS